MTAYQLKKVLLIVGAVANAVAAHIDTGPETLRIESSRIDNYNPKRAPRRR